MVTRQLKVERRTGSVRRPKTGVPPTVLRNQPSIRVSRFGRVRVTLTVTVRVSRVSVMFSVRDSVKLSTVVNMAP